MASTPIDPILRTLADTEAIRDLARRYAHHVWRKDVAGAVGLFAEDGEMDTGDRPPIRGRAALLAAYENMITGPTLLPFVHNHVVELGGDVATGTCYLDLRAAMDGRSMIGAGWYDDRYVRTGDGWKFQSRRLTLSWLVPITEGWAERG
ncbi:MAG: nuclear transport factor 2 family protein [Candidatus Binatia bacterium]